MIFLLVSYASSESWVVFVLGENHFRKYFFGNAGVWLVRKIKFSGNWFPLTQKKRLWLRKWISVPIFTSNEFRRERERERERERASERGRNITSPRRLHAPSSSRRRSQAPAPSIAIWDRELAFAPIAIGAVLREIAIDASRDRAVDRHRRFARSRSMARSSYWSLRSTAPSNPVERWASIWVLCLFFWFCLLPCSIFQTRKYFSENFLKYNQTHKNIFLSGKWNIFQKCFYANQTQPWTHDPTFHSIIKKEEDSFWSRVHWHVSFQNINTTNVCQQPVLWIPS